MNHVSLENEATRRIRSKNSEAQQDKGPRKKNCFGRRRKNSFRQESQKRIPQKTSVGGSSGNRHRGGRKQVLQIGLVLTWGLRRKDKGMKNTAKKKAKTNRHPTTHKRGVMGARHILTESGGECAAEKTRPYGVGNSLSRNCGVTRRNSGQSGKKKTRRKVTEHERVKQNSQSWGGGEKRALRRTAGKKGQKNRITATW